MEYDLPEAHYETLNIKKVRPDPNNVRQTLSRKELEGLASSFEHTNYIFDDMFPGGLIQPVVVNKENGKYEVVAGHRRYFGHIVLRRKEIFSKIYHNLTPEQKKLIQLIENETKVPYRKSDTAHNLFEFYKLMLYYESDLAFSDAVEPNSIDELGRVVNNLVPGKELSDIYSINDFSEMTNKSTRVIRESFRYVTLNKRLQNEVNKNNLSYSSAIQIARLPRKKAQYDFWNRIKNNKLSAKKVREEIKEELQQKDFELSHGETVKIPVHLRVLYKNLNYASKFLKSFLEIEKIDNSIWRYDYAIKLNGGLKGLFGKCEKAFDDIRDKLRDNTKYFDWLEKYGDRKRETLQERLIRELKNIKKTKKRKRSKSKLRKLLINKIINDPKQPRKNFEGLEKLAESYNQIGQIHPVIVRPVKCCSYATKKDVGKFMLVIGERRWRAANLDISELKKLESFVVNVNDAEARVLQYEEDLFDDVLLSERAEGLYTLFKMKKKEKGKKYTINQFAMEHKHLGTNTVRDALKYHALDRKLKDIHQAGLLRYNAAIKIGEIENKGERFEFALESILLNYSDDDVEKKLKEDKAEKDQKTLISKKEIEDMEIKGRRQMLLKELSDRLNSICYPIKLKSLEKDVFSNHTVVKKYYELFKLFNEVNEIVKQVD